MKYLIVNADDFGLSVYINEGIIRAHKAGSVTSATLMINREFARDAASLARENPNLCVGLHLDLDDLLGKDETGPERFGMERMSRLLSNSRFLKEVEAEIDTQIRRFKNTGLELTHIDGHHHLHAIPELFPLIVNKMVSYGIKTIRFSREFDLIKYPPISWDEQFFQEMKNLLEKHRIRVANHFVTGWQPYDLRSIGEGVTELMVHPGTKEGWRIKELETLESSGWTDAVKAGGIRLISFRDLAEMAID
ncbi:MAG: ChbG/HpnK family deacetylase [Deltaproteobacteria bacterium]|nr:ChbG/HpnK family deacetylase [Deltaproteobacteria bacterium]